MNQELRKIITALDAYNKKHNSNFIIRGRNAQHINEAKELVNYIIDQMKVDNWQVRTTTNTYIRSVIMTILRTHYQLSLREMSKLLGRSNHATAINWDKVGRNALATKDSEYLKIQEQVERITNYFYEMD